MGKYHEPPPGWAAAHFFVPLKMTLTNAFLPPTGIILPDHLFTNFFSNAQRI
jgi:hypothetical protein